MNALPTVSKVMAAALVLGLAQPLDAAAATRPTITLQPIAVALVDQPFKFTGTLRRTGQANNKTVIGQVRSDGKWVGVLRRKRLDDGAYSLPAVVTEAGTFRIRTLVKKDGRLLDRSPVREIQVVAAQLPPVPDPGAPPPPPPTTGTSLQAARATAAPNTGLLGCYGTSVNNDPPYQVTGTGLVWGITQLWYLTSSGWNYIWGDWNYAWSSTGLVYGAWYDYNTGGFANTDSFTVQSGLWVAARNWVYANGQWYAAWSDSTEGIFCRTF